MATSISWMEYNDRFVGPAIRRASEILAERGKADSYTLADVESAIRQASRELGLHEQIVDADLEPDADGEENTCSDDTRAYLAGEFFDSRRGL